MDGGVGFRTRVRSADSLERLRSAVSPSVETDVATAHGAEQTVSESEDGREHGEPMLSLDQVFEILKNERRREVMSYLRTNGGEATLSDLAEHIAALENDTTVRQISSSQRKRVYVGLYQCHLPKMNDMEIIDFEKNRGTVRLGPNASLLAPYLTQDAPGVNWPVIYTTVTLVGLGVALSSLLLDPSGVVSTATALLAVAGIGLCSVVHLVSS
jgi:DNA-binding transcriptional ArsR family regulator